MTPEIRLKVQRKLSAFLNREPTEQEIANSPTDSTLMHWITEDEQQETRNELAKIKSDINGIIKR